MRVFMLILGFVTVAACHFGQSTPERKDPVVSPEAKTVAQAHKDAASMKPGRRSDHSQDTVAPEGLDEDCRAFLSGMKIRTAVSPDDNRLTSPVKTHIENVNLPSSKNHRFLISARGGHWAVRFVDTEALCGGRRPKFDTYHVDEKAGKMQILFIEAWI